MARTRTLTNLISDVRMRAGMENSTFVTDAEVTEYINQSIAEFQDLILDHEGAEFFMTSTTVTTAAGTASYSLPAAFYECHKVLVDLGGTQNYTLMPYDLDEHGEAKAGTSWGWFQGGPFPRYRIVGSNIYFSPIPTGVFTVTVWYTPAATRLSAGGDTLDGVNGWEEWVVIDSAIKCLEKEESDVTFLFNQREKLEQRIARHASRRDKGGPTKIRNISRVRNWLRSL